MSDPDAGGLSDADMERYGELQAEFMHLGGYELESRATEILAGLGIQADRHGEAFEAFSGGWKMRIALAKILLLAP
jgi:ATP-binding cassette subfamily F protein 3